MFQDVDWSRETMMLYKQSSSQSEYDTSMQSASSSVEMEVQVLTTGYWPVYPQYAFHLPQILLDPQEHFENYYKNKYQGRRITWQYALGHCVVKANGLGKPYEFIVSLCQALVLLQFNEQSVWTLPDLMKQIGLQSDREEMERVLQSLSVAKEGTRILKKLDFDASPRRKKCRTSVDDKDQFTVDEKFESNQRRIRINNIMMKETKEEREKTVEAVSRDRLYLIDAVLVRILKARKTIMHQDLIPQVLDQLKVPATTADVKKRIESLIEREYMERDAKERNRYNYLA
jgi:cullin 4